MKIEKGKTYYIEATAKGIVFFPSGKYYTHGEEIKGNLEGTTLLMVENGIDIIEIKEVKNTRDVKPKVKEEPKVEVKESTPIEEVNEEPEAIAKDVEEEFEDMLKED